MATRIDGKKIADDIKQYLLAKISLLDREVAFSIVYVGFDPVIDNFIEYKKKFGSDIGVSVEIYHFDEMIDEQSLINAIHDISKQSDGVIVQLPLPQHLNSQRVLDTVPVEKDIDMLSTHSRSLFASGNSKRFPPVTGAIIEVLHSKNYLLNDKRIALVGYGNLVGKPFGAWLENQGIPFHIVDYVISEEMKKNLLKISDVIVAGAGVPHLITGDEVKNNVVLLDAGTSEAGKKVVGDIHPSAQDKSLFYTPVPGGLGPITIAILYRNLIESL